MNTAEKADHGSEWLWLLTDSVDRNLKLRHMVKTDASIGSLKEVKEFAARRGYGDNFRPAKEFLKRNENLEKIQSSLFGAHVRLVPLLQTEKQRESAKVRSFELQSQYVKQMPNSTITPASDVTLKYPKIDPIDEVIEGTLTGFSVNKGTVRVRQAGGAIATAQVCEAEMYYYGPKPELGTVVTFDTLALETDQEI